MQLVHLNSMDEPLLVLTVVGENRPGKALRSGDPCPQCKQAQLDYDGLLNLACPSCGFTETGGCFG